MATITNLQRLFAKHRDVFPHIRQDYLVRCIDSGNVLYEHSNGYLVGALIYKIYSRNTNIANKGDIQLAQIVTSYQRCGVGSQLFNQLEMLAAKVNASNIILTVRRSNVPACKFYEKKGMVIVGQITWKNNTIPGIIYRKIVNGG